MDSDKYLVKREEIEAMEGLDKTHFMNGNARRINKSLGDLTGLTGLGFHIIEVAPGHETTEHHVHYYEDECVYVLDGTATAYVDDEPHDIKSGDFLGYPFDQEYRRPGFALHCGWTAAAPRRCGLHPAEQADLPQQGSAMEPC